MERLVPRRVNCDSYGCECKATARCPKGYLVSTCLCSNSNPLTPVEEYEVAAAAMDAKPVSASSSGEVQYAQPEVELRYHWVLASSFSFARGHKTDECTCSWVNTIPLVSSGGTHCAGVVSDTVVVVEPPPSIKLGRLLPVSSTSSTYEARRRRLSPCLLPPLLGPARHRHLFHHLQSEYIPNKAIAVAHACCYDPKAEEHGMYGAEDEIEETEDLQETQAAKIAGKGDKKDSKTGEAPQEYADADAPPAKVRTHATRASPTGALPGSGDACPAMRRTVCTMLTRPTAALSKLLPSAPPSLLEVRRTLPTPSRTTSSTKWRLQRRTSLSPRMRRSRPDHAPHTAPWLSLNSGAQIE